MLEASLKTVNNDINTLIKNAQVVFQEATTLTGEKATEARQKGMQLLDSALGKAQDAQASAYAAGKEMCVSADHYVKENPWRTISAAASIGLLLGVILARK